LWSSRPPDPAVEDCARNSIICFSWTGGGLFASSQLREHVQLRESGVFGNPHSITPTSAASTELVERARDYVLGFFRASAEEYVAIASDGLLL